ncbi:MAG: hypothetical protein A2504_13025 [Bdellovibrionales bacterium RIFOXYD12_FULL_39_22]|nr:MAG: hypothetical protein A2385_00825 [Bdellovibrionales bacterium RIFOXYB1_FULL_39_21]OFZ43551.1 MAG: hypothetical protein A2485_12495 [Bdellovibrionales bacterium RIFOXYC12_FULL_39_17]OFZ44570.1 MAG: hypothetical protein A2404_10185 [Bdellovibrionales bacterium RIFOXYC1_FULL_39_130]OFZ71254.1 MAG: hypothetical protein A2451_12010 [Bdellovibrionales bacterium RIFOXYC2_FULL_39_8]OFZ76329.1 MAG: hypothetical protein A2560_06805 [Bdellovibrionales bacterium RIFOXYD1_FULL_39_84]OFZ94595.1 MAG:
MQELKTVLDTIMSNDEQANFYRFVVYLGEEKGLGKIEKTKTIGMAYLKDGHATYTVRLWTLLNERFYLIPHKSDVGRYYIMTREANKFSESRKKYFWNIVGMARVDAANGYMRLDFDLIEKTIYMSIYPEMKESSSTLAHPNTFMDAA